MKRSPQLQRIVDRMAPGALCREGFLGADRRPLEEILDADRSTVAGLGLTHEQLGRGLGEVLAAGVAAQGGPARVGERLTAVHREAMGRIPSPWPGEGTFPKGEVELTDEAAGLTLRFTALSAHLVARHGFYQGRGSPYRLEPDVLARVLGMRGNAGLHK